MSQEYATGAHCYATATEQFTHLKVHVVTTAGYMFPNTQRARFRHIICSSLVQIRP